MSNLMKYSMLLIVTLMIISGCGSSEVDSSNSSNETNSTETTEESNTQEETSEMEQSQESEAEATTTSFADGVNSDLLLVTGDQLELSQESSDFITTNKDLLPATTDENIEKVKGLVDTSISYKLLNKNVAPYLSKFTTFSGYVVSVEENQLENGETVSLTHVIDDESNSYQVLMYKSTGEILEEDSVQFWGVPLGASSFENVSGGTTNVQNFLGSHIVKIQ